jgi:hypothetical protein
MPNIFQIELEEIGELHLAYQANVCPHAMVFVFKVAVEKALPNLPTLVVQQTSNHQI